MNKKHTSGFTLLELIISLTIFVVVASLTVQIFGNGSARIDLQKLESEAYILAESKLDELITAKRSKDIELSGEIAKTPFHYSVDIESQSYPGEERSYRLLSIIVSVFWSDNQEDRIELRSLKLESDDDK